MIFGIDGGGTKSRIRLEDEKGNLFAEAIGSSTNIYSVGAKTVEYNLKNLIQSACGKCKIEPIEISSCCIGSAGLDRKDEKEFFYKVLKSICPNAKIKLCTDAEIMLIGGLQAYEGYCLIAGTGSVAFARNKEGTLARSGGLGYMLGDEGSALWIAYEAIKRSYKSLEHRDIKSNMIYSLVDFFELNQPNEFIAMLHKNFDKATIAKACPLVFDMAAKGDLLAKDIVEKAIAELTLLVQSIIQIMPLQNNEIVLAGGVLEKNIEFRQKIIEKITPLGVKPIQAKASAEYGACMLARI